MKDNKPSPEPWTADADEIFLKNGLIPKRVNKTGGCVYPAPKRFRQVDQETGQDKPQNSKRDKQQEIE